VGSLFALRQAEYSEREKPLVDHRGFPYITEAWANLIYKLLARNTLRNAKETLVL
jgi:hypothetical protein